MQFQNPFKRPTVAQVNAESLALAQFNLTEHKAAAEYHVAMIAMYQARITRLNRESAGIQ